MTTPANVTGNVKGPISFSQVPSSGPLSNVALPINYQFSTVLKTAGILADQVDLISAQTLAFVASTSQNLDLSSLVDVIGNAIDFTSGPGRVRLIAFRMQGQVDGSYLLLGDAVTNEWDGFLSAAGTLKIFPSSTLNDGWFILVAPNTTGMPVTSSTKILKMTPSAHAFNVDIIVAGCHA